MKSIINTKEVIGGLEMIINHNLERMIDRMNHGEYLNTHNDSLKQDQCDGIVMLATGDICPVFRGSVCCLNPLKISGKSGSPILSEWSIGGTIVPMRSLSETVARHNESLYSNIEENKLEFLAKYMIVGYHSFREDW